MDIPKPTRIWNPSTDKARCSICKGETKSTSELRPSGQGFKVICANGHVTNGIPPIEFTSASLI